MSAVVDSATVRRYRLSRLWTQYRVAFAQICELVSTQLLLSHFDELGYGDRTAVLRRSEFLIESWASSRMHLLRAREGLTPMKEALNRICRLGDDIALIDCLPRTVH